jgi:hypothetical protein
MSRSYNNKGAAPVYRKINHAYDEIKISKEDFFVSYAVRGPSFVNDYGGVQYDMPLRGPLPSDSPVSQPGPLSSQSQCVEHVPTIGTGVI